MNLELIADYACSVGENPLWHPMEQRLYWCDITTGRLFRYHPDSGRHEQFRHHEAIGGFTVQADGALLLFGARGSVKIWREGVLTTLLEEIADERETRFNDVIADPQGRVFCGTMATNQRQGRLYRLDPDLHTTVLLEGIGCPNGLGFTADRKCMYFTDSFARRIYSFDYDERQGSIGNQRVFIQAPEQDGMPDGMTVDSLGYIWSAYWDGSAVVRFTPDGIEERRIAFPVKKPSSVAFGGKNLTDIYITSAGGDNKQQEGASAGALFRFDAGVHGVPEFLSRIGE